MIPFSHFFQQNAKIIITISKHERNSTISLCERKFLKKFGVKEVKLKRNKAWKEMYVLGVKFSIKEHSFFGREFLRKNICAEKIISFLK